MGEVAPKQPVLPISPSAEWQDKANCSPTLGTLRSQIVKKEKGLVRQERLGVTGCTSWTEIGWDAAWGKKVIYFLPQMLFPQENSAGLGQVSGEVRGVSM